MLHCWAIGLAALPGLLLDDTVVSLAHTAEKYISGDFLRADHMVVEIVRAFLLMSVSLFIDGAVCKTKATNITFGCFPAVIYV